MEQIKKQIEFVKKIKAIYSEVVIILDNGGISNQISNIENNFKKIISEMNPLFQGIAANDSKDLILFILQQLHEELKLKVNGSQGTGQDEGNADQTNRIAVLEEFKESMKNNVSLISELCFGMNEIVSDCLNCRQNG